MTTTITKIERRKGIRIMQDISKETFDKMTPKSQLSVMFDYHKASYGLLDRQCKRLDKVETQQKRWKLVTASIGAGTGLFGGALTMLAKLKWWG